MFSPAISSGVCLSGHPYVHHWRNVVYPHVCWRVSDIINYIHPNLTQLLDHGGAVTTREVMELRLHVLSKGTEFGPVWRTFTRKLLEIAPPKSIPNVLCHVLYLKHVQRGQTLQVGKCIL
jgi:hypothetical protein